MSRKSDQRPIMVSDIKKFQKMWLQTSSKLLHYIGFILLGLGVLSIFMPAPQGTFKLPFTIIAILGGIASFAISSWAKKVIKKI